MRNLTLIILALLLTGCGGGGGSNPAGNLATGPVQVSINWPARSRVDGLSSALSVVLTLARAAEDGSDAVVILNRQSNPAAYTAQATFPGKVRKGSWELTARFYAVPDGSGTIVGDAVAEVRVQPNGSLTSPDGSPLGPIFTYGRVASVTVDPGQTVTIGATTELAFTARDLNNNIIALTRGSAFFTVTAGSNALAVDPDGTAHGLASGTAMVTVSVDSQTSQPQPVIVQGQVTIRRLTLQTNDLAYDRVTDRIFASVPDTDTTGHGNQVVAINPHTAAITGSVNVGSNPGALAISDDGTYLYVGLQGANAVQRVDLRTMTADLRFNLEVDNFFGPRFANDMAVLPGNPHAVAISERHEGVSPSFAGLTIFDDGVPRPNGLSYPVGFTNYITFDTTASRLYGYEAETSGYNLSFLKVDPSGVYLESSVSGLIMGFNQKITFSNGLIYSTIGQVVDPNGPARVGTFDLGLSGFDVSPTQGFAIDGPAKRAYFAVSKNSNSYLTILAFNTDTYLPVASLDVSITSDYTAWSVVRRAVLCGSGMLALNVDGGQQRDKSQVIIVEPAPGS